MKPEVSVARIRFRGLPHGWATAREVLVLVIALLGCDRSSSPKQAPSTESTGSAPAATRTAPAKPARACSLAPIALRVPMPDRLVAIGDLHGDIGGTRSALRAAGAIGDDDHWIGGKLVVVQTGDVLDRGDDEQEILDLLDKLAVEAKAAGGAVIELLGNHELMNAAGDFRYVTRGGFADFADVPGLDTSRYAQVPEAARARISALGPGGVYAHKLAHHNVIAIVGDTVFSHAGVLGNWAKRIDATNLESRCWLDGQAGGPRSGTPALTSEDSPVWTRELGGGHVDCAALETTLDTLRVKREVVGHTVQDGGITSACDGKVWRIDVGLAKEYGGPIEVLELTPSHPPKILHGTR